MPRLFVIDDRDETIDLCHRHLPQFDYVTRCERHIPCQVCDQRDKGCRLKCAHDFQEADEALRRLETLPDLVVLDLDFALPEERLLPEDKSGLPSDEKQRKAALNKLRREQGLLISRRLRQDHPSLPVVMLTTTDTQVSEANGDPLVYFCEHEIADSRSLVAEITRALRLHHEAQEGPVFWGKSPAMIGLRRSLEVLARSPLPTLLQGETGTGKSFLAEHVIHPRSGCKGPFVVTDLSTIPAELLPAHLFGARRGAFTGAVADQQGVFEQADGGVLFLDEIGNLDLDVQRQLLLVLERGEVRRLGDAQARKVTVKLVAATHQDLGALVRAGRFRLDLLQRLNPAAALRVPPLRERTGDLPDLLRFALLEALASPALLPLVRQYLAAFPTPEDFDASANSVLFGRPRADRTPRNAFTICLGQAALERLVAYAWPGNARELRSFATNALVSVLARSLDGAGGKHERAAAVLPISDQMIGQFLQGQSSSEPDSRLAAPALAPPGDLAEIGRGGVEGFALNVTVAPRAALSQVSIEVERQYLSALFRSCRGDLTKMARTLLGPRGTSRQIHLRLNQLGLGVRKLREIL